MTRNRGRQSMERRENQRFPVRLTKPQTLEKRLPYRVLNISKSGCLLECRKALGDVCSSIVLELPLPAGAESLTLAAIIVRKAPDLGIDESGWLRYGLRFDGMDKISQMILDAYVEFLRRDLHIAQLEEAWVKLKRVHEKIELLIACEEKKMTTFLH